MSTAVETLPTGFQRTVQSGAAGNLSYLIGGEGPPVMLLHGWPQTSRCWLGVAPALADAGYTVVAPDLPGLGASDPLPDGFAKDAQAATLRAVMRSLGFDGGLRVVGHDIGGYVAFSWARCHPDEVTHLAVVDTTVPGLGLERAMDVARGGRWHHGFFMTPDVPAMLIADSEDEFFGWWFGRLASNQAAFPPEMIDATTATYRGRDSLARSFGQYRALLDDGRVNAAWLDAGGRLGMAVAAIGGGDSLGDSVARDLRAAAPDLLEIVIDGAGHFVAEEQPERFVDHVLRFLGS
jgi:pimeloyl-ACP methyl ester carboxylesterase